MSIETVLRRLRHFGASMPLLRHLPVWSDGVPVTAPCEEQARERPVRVTYGEDGRRTVSWEAKTDSETTVTLNHHYPDALRHHYQPTEANKDVVLFAGSFGLDGDPDLLRGEVRWRWVSRPRIEAVGHRHTRDADILDILSGKKDSGMWVSRSVIDLDMPDGSLPPAPTVAATQDDTPHPPGTASVVVDVEQEIGSGSNLDRVTFLVPNGWSGLDGGTVCDDASRDVFWRGRAICTGAGWVVTFDRVRSMAGDQPFRALRDQQGSRFTHVGEIRRADGSPFDSGDVFGVLERIRIGLDLALGRRVTCALPVGYSDDKPIWTRWFATLVHPYRNVGQLLDDTVANSQVGGIVGLMLDATEDAVALTAIKAAVGYYTSANNDVMTDLSVALPVSGLQLMAYYHFVSSNAATYSRSQWKAATDKTADEIGFLLDDLKVARPIPTHFANLLAARASMSVEKQSGDALTTVIEMRNVVTHPTRDLPAEKYDPYMWFEASTLARYWLCLSVLKEIGYIGPIADVHQPSPRWTGQTTTPPWAPPSAP